MTDLVIKQTIFTNYLSKLLAQFYDTAITMGEAWRSEETCELYAQEGKGIAFSCHELRLAVDLNVIVNGALSNCKQDYQPLGDYWKQLPALFPPVIQVVCCWGGDFSHLEDIYHFSISHNGVE